MIMWEEMKNLKKNITQNSWFENDKNRIPNIDKF